MHERFGLTVGGNINNFDVTPLQAGAYLNWAAYLEPSHPNGMDYYPMIYVNDQAFEPYGYWPNGKQLEWRVRANPGATWLIGNEADYRWHNDHATPEAYARIYHDVYTAIKSLDPSARIAANALATVSPLRLAWLDRVWQAYQDLYGTEMPVDIWTVHTYIVNEMVHEWGPEIPPGFDNVVGFGAGNWEEVPLTEASGGTIHRSQDPGARAYFAFVGDAVTVYLRTGPNAGIADIYIDNRALPPYPPKPARPVESVDLYAPVPGFVSRTYDHLPIYADPHLGRRHHVRIQVSGRKNPASGGFWVGVDAAEAESTASLPGGRLEDNHPYRARILTSANDHDNLTLIVSLIRAMRQWMADHGQRHKPLINTEYGILMGEEQGFDEQRVINFMRNSFDLFVSDAGLVDAEVGMPEDGNRLLQEWFWFIVAINYFNGWRIHTGLFDANTHELLPLGQTYADYVRNLVTDYIDLEVPFLELHPSWPLFIGEPAQVQIRSSIHNRGDRDTGPFWVQLSDETDTIAQWQVDGLSADNGGNHIYAIEYMWETEISSDQQVTVIADSTGIVDEPCAPNNSRTETLVAPPYTDLALTHFTVTPPYLDSRTDRLSLETEVVNLGSLGTAAGEVVVNFWDGKPEDGGTLLYTKAVTPGHNARRATIRFQWQDIQPGQHELIAEVVPVAEETDQTNNRLRQTVVVPSGSHFRFIPLVTYGSQVPQNPESLSVESQVPVYKLRAWTP